MTRIKNIYNRLDIIDNLIDLQQPYFSHGKMISDHVTELIRYVEHITTLIWERQRRLRLKDFETSYILPAMDEIYILMDYTLRKGEKPSEKLSNSIKDLIGVVSWWIIYIENHEPRYTDHSNGLI